MSLPQLHGLIANSITVFTLLVTLLAAWKVIRKQPLGPDFWGAVIIGEGLILIQAVIGIILTIMRLPPGSNMHFLYGPLVALTWPVLYSYTHSQDERRQAIWWLIGSAFLFALSIRTIGTGTL